MSYPQLPSPEEKLADAKAGLGIPKIADRLWADDAEAQAGKARLDELHRAKIRLADEVLVVGDYVGTSTRAEIAYARELGKPIRFTHPEVDPERAA
ncbi:hypothetical protein ABZ383_27495 [Streptomyces sp. NPDC005900]|uniref:hypothetical protein n=1 Tax=Streptomyces sp. NPDC005900 TaxID=3154569 RepID=UPI0033EA445B